MFTERHKMGKTNYKDYTIEELIHDQDVVNRIKGISSENEWQELLAENKDCKEKIVLARKIISAFSVSDEALLAEKKDKLWLSISQYDKSLSNKNRTFVIRNFIKIAASVLIILSIGSLLYLNSTQNSSHNFSELQDSTSLENSVLLLANGDKVEVLEDESNIMILDSKEAIQINNDSIYQNKLNGLADTKDMPLNELIVPFGKRTSLVLSDGSKVWINAGSKFAFPQRFVGKNRTVYLDGEAYFEVTKNKEMPFIVSSENMDVQVLGTKFNVSTFSTDKFCETVLLEGSVDVYREGLVTKSKTRLKPYQKATYLIDEKQMLVQDEPNADKKAAWIYGWYEFSDESIVQVMIKLERYYNVSFNYTSEKIDDAMPISGKLDLKESFDDVLYLLSKVSEIEFELQGTEVTIVNK